MKALNFEPIYELRWILTLKLSSFDKLNDYYYVQDNSATDFMLKLSLAIFLKNKVDASHFRNGAFINTDYIHYIIKQLWTFYSLNMV